MNEPDKPWRVHADHGFITDHGSMVTAFEQVKIVYQWGRTASVYRWDDGDWRPYRHSGPRKKSAENSWPF